MKRSESFSPLLGETCNDTIAAAEAGISASAVYERRRADGRLRAAWAEAIGSAYHKLELILLERALNGTEKIVSRRDGSAERMREYPNQLALTLLKMNRDTAVEVETKVPQDEAAEIREPLLKKLERLRRRSAWGARLKESRHDPNADARADGEARNRFDRRAEADHRRNGAARAAEAGRQFR